MSFIAIDFEASCLPQFGRSFPIEVGIASSHGWSRSWLIQPHESWAGWDWTQEAQALHGLTTEKLNGEGLPVQDVVRLLRMAVGSSDVIADSYLDDDWSRTLFDAAGEAEHLPVHCLADLQAFHEIDPQRLRQAIAEADLQRTRRHRAEDDARWLVRMLRELDLDSGGQLMPARAA
ncbi:DNA polymerase III epsilon subunit-like protein [Sphingobium xanthum]|jgi:DNA polymerase III epsilon subunit-like protein|uniref:3'-5' exonuclease n=1 Tax=Sphingobium xanthum TaxID=1387165 RepID=UPI001C8C42BF|nr:hypothetical protein [Sphingobium xanthum]